MRELLPTLTPPTTANPMAGLCSSWAADFNASTLCSGPMSSDTALPLSVFTALLFLNTSPYADSNFTAPCARLASTSTWSRACWNALAMARSSGSLPTRAPPAAVVGEVRDCTATAPRDGE